MTRFDTKLVHAPAQHDNNTGAVTTPIYKATTFAYPEIGAPVKDDYSRSGNPTRRALEEQLAALEEGTALPFHPGWLLSMQLWQYLSKATT